MSRDRWVKAGLELAKAGLPFIGGILAGPAGAAGGAAAAKVAASVAAALGISADDPDLIEQLIKTDPAAALRLRELETTVMREQIQAQTTRAVAITQARVQRDLEELRTIVSTQVQTNDTIRAELSSNDPYVRRMRPTYGYAITFCLLYTIIVVGVLMLRAAFTGGDVPGLIKALGDLATGSWEIVVAALAVLGVYVKMRSNDKARILGAEPVRFMDIFRKRDTSS